MGGGRPSAPAPPPPPPPEKKPEPASEAVRRKRIAEGRVGTQSTVGGDDSGATKTLLGA